MSTISTNIKDKVVFITGAAHGIGKSILTHFCGANADVIFCDVDKESGNKLCNSLSDYRCQFYAVDIADAKAYTEVLNRVLLEKGNIDILINNAGVSRFESILNLSIEAFDEIQAINLRPLFIGAKKLAEHRTKHPHLNTYGRIISLASTRYLMSEPSSEAYAASKGGVVSLTHALALSLAPLHITANSISPGWIENEDYTQLTENDHLQHPSGRVGKPEDIARMCLFLAEPANDFINGQNFIIDGGMTKKMIYEG